MDNEERKHYLKIIEILIFELQNVRKELEELKKKGKACIEQEVRKVI